MKPTPPKPLSADQLLHPKNQKSNFNGDRLRKEKNFNHRVSTTTGCKPPSNVREVKVATLDDPHGRDRTGRISPPDRNLSPTFVADPSPRQQAMTFTPKKRGRKR